MLHAFLVIVALVTISAFCALCYLASRFISLARQWARLYHFSTFASKRITEIHFEELQALKDLAKYIRDELAKPTPRMQAFRSQLAQLVSELDRLRVESPLTVDALSFTLFRLFGSHIVSLIAHMDSPNQLIELAGYMAHTRLDNLTKTLPTSSESLRNMLFVLLKGTRDGERRVVLLRMVAMVMYSSEIYARLTKDGTNTLHPYDALIYLSIAYTREAILSYSHELMTYSYEQDGLPKTLDYPLYRYMSADGPWLLRVFGDHLDPNTCEHQVIAIIRTEVVHFCRIRNYRSRFAPAWY